MSGISSRNTGFRGSEDVIEMCICLLMEEDTQLSEGLAAALNEAIIKEV